MLHFKSMKAETNTGRPPAEATARWISASDDGGRGESHFEESVEVGVRSATARWGRQDTELFREGWLSVPTKFIRCYAALNPPLSPGEALFVLQLMTFKWDDAAPFPSYGRIAKTMGVTDKMARRYAQGLQRKGYLTRQFQKRGPNKFDLTRLFDALAGVRREPATERTGEGVIELS